MKTLKFWPAFGFALLLAACHTAPPKGGHVAQSPSPTSVIVVRADNEILAYALRFGALPADEQRKEQAQVMQAYNSNKQNLTNRVKAALVLSLPASRQRDNVKALALLDDIQADNEADADTKAIAALLKEYVNERQKLEENTAKLIQKAADEHKRLEAAQARTDELQQRADGLQQKLDELKNIERALINRDQVKPR